MGPGTTSGHLRLHALKRWATYCLELRYSATFDPHSPAICPSFWLSSMAFQTHLLAPRKKQGKAEPTPVSSSHLQAGGKCHFLVQVLGLTVHSECLWSRWFLASHSFHGPDQNCHGCDGGTYLEVL